MQTLRVVRGKGPSHQSTPIMTNEVEAFESRRAGDFVEVGDQARYRILPD